MSLGQDMLQLPDKLSSDKDGGPTERQKYCTSTNVDFSGWEENSNITVETDSGGSKDSPEIEIGISDKGESGQPDFDNAVHVIADADKSTTEIVACWKPGNFPPSQYQVVRIFRATVD